jgi:hypothetical protein
VQISIYYFNGTPASDTNSRTSDTIYTGPGTVVSGAGIPPFFADHTRTDQDILRKEKLRFNVRSFGLYPFSVALLKMKFQPGSEETVNIPRKVSGSY